MDLEPRKPFFGVKLLQEICRLRLIANLKHIEDVGSVSYRVVRPILARMGPEQLQKIEHKTPEIAKYSDPLWVLLIQRDFEKYQLDESKKEGHSTIYWQLKHSLEKKREAALERLRKNLKKNEIAKTQNLAVTLNEENSIRLVNMVEGRKKKRFFKDEGSSAMKKVKRDLLLRQNMFQAYKGSSSLSQTLRQAEMYKEGRSSITLSTNAPGSNKPPSRPTGFVSKAANEALKQRPVQARKPQLGLFQKHTPMVLRSSSRITVSTKKGGQVVNSTCRSGATATGEVKKSDVHAQEARVGANTMNREPETPMQAGSRSVPKIVRKSLPFSSRKSGIFMPRAKVGFPKRKVG